MIAIRGEATAEELAAVLAALRERPVPAPDPYERWRATRLRVLRARPVARR